ncbi:MAG: hypothetical protein AAGI46_12850 [Planctomycetota bacterium]
MRVALWAAIFLICGLPVLVAFWPVVSRPSAWLAAWETREAHFNSLGFALASGLVAGMVAILPALLVASRVAAGLVVVIGVTLLAIPEQAWAYGVAEAWRQVGWTAPPETFAASLRGVVTVATQLWPIPAAATAFTLARLPVDVVETARIDGVSRRVIARVVLPAWLVGSGVVSLLTLRMTTPFDLGAFLTSGVAARQTYAEATGDLGDKTAAAIGVTMPTTLVVAAGVWLVWRVSAVVSRESIVGPARLQVSGMTIVGALALLALMITPVAALVVTSGPSSPLGWIDANLPGLLNGLTLGGIVVVVASLLVALGVVSKPRWTLAIAVATFAVGGQVVALSLIRLLNARPEDGLVASLQDVAYDLLYDRPLFHAWPAAAMFAFVPLVAALWTWRGVSASLRDLAAVDGAGRLATAWRVTLPTTWPILAASVIATGLLAMAEPNAAALTYPGSLVNTMLSNVHTLAYAAMAEAALLAAGVALVGTLIVVGLLGVRRVAVLPVIAASLFLVGCDSGDEPEAVFGTLGSGDGQLVYPRAIVYSKAEDVVWVVDRTARVQKLDAETGEFLLGFGMPEQNYGKPVGVSVDDDGNVWVPDTHYSRVIVYSPGGDELFRIGTNGQGPGEFVWPTDVLLLDDGRVLISEYGAGEDGNNDRIQLFEPSENDELAATASIGSFGMDEGQFRRPQSMTTIGDVLWVADSSNHRLLAFDLRSDTLGQLLDTIGHEDATSDAGGFRFPYGVVADGDGKLVVVEFGNNRLQRIDPETGESLGVWGGFGARPGTFRYP